MIKVDLPEELERLLARFAKELGVSREGLAVRAQAEYIEDLEDLETAKAALSEDDGEHIPLADILAELGGNADDDDNPLHAAE